MFQYAVPDTVPPIAQPYTMACWATVLTSMVSWRKSASYTIEDVMDLAGPKYREIYEKNTGLYPADTPELLQSIGLVAEPPMNYSSEGWLNLLQTYGPLWVTIAPDPDKPWSMHAIIITGIRSDDTVEGIYFTFIDPADGLVKEITISEMIKLFEAVAGLEQVIIQVCHFPAAGS
ncbi:hypothetical protein GK047_12845 [Paenibacillus sp. SYP-B3998]|uniref:Peptidase C39-like domain-containing protein n=1 Tax=Paenibacillus sp. SYP-B3998 TaxID=2678564 RepID=A0A6G3ZXS5_9BACL|nr:papain-like cysteine protease family protein [Paenibacillus sp. SYP-B3998]NEW06890.1 hypothetical protein [Paenibacillus sp. SYP-B3998]